MNFAELSAKSELLAGLPAKELEFLSSIAAEVNFGAGDTIFEADQPADTFHIVETGKVGLEITSPGRPPMVIQTLGDGELVGVSWLFPPYRWNWTARAITKVATFGFSALRVREECEVDSELNRWVLRAVGEEAVRRLHNTRLQLLNLYETA